MLRLYHRERAGRPVRVRWTLEEIGVPYETVILTADEARGPAHLARHPLGRVPVLETDEGFQMESTAICLQLADAYPDVGLTAPLGSRERAEIYVWSILPMTEIEPLAIRLWYADRGLAGDVADLGTRYAERLAAVAQRLEGRDFVVGDRFTIADIVLGAVLLICRKIDQLPPNALVDAYLDRLASRPAHVRAYTKEWL